MRYFLLLLSVVIAGCATRQPELWQVPTGEKFVCMHYEQDECGLTLEGCGGEPEGTVDFECLKSAVYAGPGDHYEPDISDEPSGKVEIESLSPSPTTKAPLKGKK